MGKLTIFGIDLTHSWDDCCVSSTSHLLISSMSVPTFLGRPVVSRVRSLWNPRIRQPREDHERCKLKTALFIPSMSTSVLQKTRFGQGDSKRTREGLDLPAHMDLHCTVWFVQYFHGIPRVSTMILHKITRATIRHLLTAAAAALE